MTEISDDIKYGMIEAIAHLINRDYEAIVDDFVTLEFIPEGVDLKPILPVLAKVFDQALEGGGPRTSTSKRWLLTWRRSLLTTPSASRPTSP